MKLNDEFQNSAAEYFKIQTKKADLGIKLTFAKIYLVIAVLFLLVWLWPKIQQFLANFIG
jgi:hypothetical protein